MSPQQLQQLQKWQPPEVSFCFSMKTTQKLTPNLLLPPVQDSPTITIANSLPLIVASTQRAHKVDCWFYSSFWGSVNILRHPQRLFAQWIFLCFWSNGSFKDRPRQIKRQLQAPKVDCYLFQNIASLPRRLWNILWGRMGATSAFLTDTLASLASVISGHGDLDI